MHVAFWPGDDFPGQGNWRQSRATASSCPIDSAQNYSPTRPLPARTSSSEQPPMASTSPATKKPRAPSLAGEERLKVVEDIAEQMVQGWSFGTGRAWYKRLHEEYGITKGAFDKMCGDARKVLTDSFNAVSRQDLVAQHLHRLEALSIEAAKYKQLGVVQACTNTALRAVGADAPPKT